MAKKAKKAQKKRQGSVGTVEVKKPHNGPLLSIGMIFRNDIRCIERCLKALQLLRDAIPCELIMTDTGSTDGSRAIAEKYADILLDFEWIDDFAAARNTGLDRATGKWFMFVDTDEYLQPDISELVELLTSVEDEEVVAFPIIRNYATLKMRKGDYTDFYARRIVPRTAGIRFKDAIHEFLGGAERFPAVPLSKTVFDHDGYAAELMQKKKKRNATLIEESFAENPRDLRVVAECLDAVMCKEDALKYGEISVQLVQERVERWNTYGPVCISSSILQAYNYKLPQFEKWVAIAEELYSESPFIYVDLPFFCTRYYWDAENYEKCLENAECFWKGLARYNADPKEKYKSSYGTIKGEAKHNREAVAMRHCGSLIHLGQYEQTLDRLSYVHACDSIEYTLDIRSIVLALNDIWTRSDVDCLPHLLNEWKLLREEETDDQKARMECFQSVGCGLLNSTTAVAEKRSLSSLFAALGDGCDLGRAAMLLEADDIDEAMRLLNLFEDWKLMPAKALAHVVADLGVDLPDSFYENDLESMSELANGLAKQLDNKSFAVLADWERKEIAKSPGGIVWLFSLACAIVQRHDWKEDPSLELLQAFAKLASDYLNLVYHPTVLSQDRLHLLPAIARFSWRIVKSQHLLEEGQLPESVKMLRKALNAQPGMKDMIAFLIERVNEAQKQRDEANDELRALAEKLRVMLQAFPEGSVELEAVKNSPVYQKVKHMIEN